MIRARGFSAQLRRPLVGQDEHRSGAVVQRAGVAGRHLAAGEERRLERGELLERRARPRPVVGGDDRPVRLRVRRQLPLGEAGRLRRHGPLLRALRERVHVLAGDVPALGHVLGRQAHRDVDVRRSRPRRRAAGAAPPRSSGSRRPARSTRRRPRRSSRPRPARIGMEGHPDRLQRRGAEAVDRRARHGVSGSPARSTPRRARFIPCFALREAAADHHVDDRPRAAPRAPSEHVVDREGEQVVGPHVGERPLRRAADRRARRGDDDGFWHDRPPDVGNETGPAERRPRHSTCRGRLNSARAGRASAR